MLNSRRRRCETVFCTTLHHPAVLRSIRAFTRNDRETTLANCEYGVSVRLCVHLRTGGEPRWFRDAVESVAGAGASRADADEASGVSRHDHMCRRLHSAASAAHVEHRRRRDRPWRVSRLAQRVPVLVAVHHRRLEPAPARHRADDAGLDSSRHARLQTEDHPSALHCQLLDRVRVEHPAPHGGGAGERHLHSSEAVHRRRVRSLHDRVRVRGAVRPRNLHPHVRRTHV